MCLSSSCTISDGVMMNDMAGGVARDERPPRRAAVAFYLLHGVAPRPNATRTTPVPINASLEELRAVTGLGRRRGNGPAVGDALAWRQGCVVLDVVNEEVEGLLCVRLDELQLRKRAPERFDMVAVLHLIQPVLSFALVVVAVARGVDHRLVCFGSPMNRQQCIHGSSD